MKIRLQSSWEIKKSEGAIELFSGTKRKKYGIKSKHPGLISFLDALKEGIEYPDNILFETERSGLKEEIAHSLIKNLRENGVLFEDDSNGASAAPSVQSMINELQSGF